jgi:DNA repair protein RadC
MTEALDQIAGAKAVPMVLPAGAMPADLELLAAMVSGNGYGHALARRLLSRFGSVAAIARAHPAELTIVEGIGQATAARLAAAFQLARRAIAEQPPVRIASSEDIAAVAAPMLHGRTRERLVVVICNRRHRVIGYEVVSEGSADRAVVAVREVLVAALRRDGLVFAVAHNHPGGDPAPSREDIHATRRLQQAAQATGLKLLGHVVVTDTGWQRVPGGARR